MGIVDATGLGQCHEASEALVRGDLPHRVVRSRPDRYPALDSTDTFSGMRRLRREAGQAADSKALN